MRRIFGNIQKRIKRVKLFKPSDIRLSFYIYPIEDISRIFDDENDFEEIKSSDVNPLLYDQPTNWQVAGNLLALYDEGVLTGVKTGADLGIYSYIETEKPKTKTKIEDINNFVQSIDTPSTIDRSYFEDDYDFSHCVLADSDPLNGSNSQIVKTFRGYVEITNDDFCYIRKCDGKISNDSLVYISKQDVVKYQLRHGDEIVGICAEDGDKLMLTTLLTINQISKHLWSPYRPWFNKLSVASNKIAKGSGTYTKTIINKFEIIKGDNIFVYINKTCSKSKILPNLIDELSKIFDKVVYINPKYKPSKAIESKSIVKFCAPVNSEPNYQATTALLGAHHARRLVEMGYDVALVIDDLEQLMCLDKVLNNGEQPLCKTLLNTAMECEHSCTNFTLIQLRKYNINSLNLSNELKCFENLGIVMDCNEIDLFNSYRN